MRDIIIDCDPGIDDSVALIMALKSEELNVLGICAVGGNSAIEKTTVNALRICRLLGSDTPVYRGMPGPLVREQVQAGFIHGESGLGDVRFPPLDRGLEKEFAPAWMADAIARHEGKVTVVSLGPLTDTALALRMRPEIAGNIEEIVMMGGSTGLGNITPSAEFNVYADPEAAHIVFSSGIPIAMMGLDITTKAVCGPEEIRRISEIGNRVSGYLTEALTFYLAQEKKYFDYDEAPLHDPVCIAYLLKPELIRCVPMNVVVDISQGHDYGRTVCDFFSVTGREVNCKVGMDIDNEGFLALIERMVSLY